MLLRQLGGPEFVVDAKDGKRTLEVAQEIKASMRN
jgi:hypothetical protein